jgi:hypothetical protein
MAKEQTRAAREKRKPKQDKPKKTGPSYEQGSSQSIDALKQYGKGQQPPKR